MYRLFSVSVALLLTIFVCSSVAFAQEQSLDKPQKLKASRVEARTPAKYRLKLGLPLRRGNADLELNALAGPEWPEAIFLKEKWARSYNPELGMDNWSAIEINQENLSDTSKVLQFGQKMEDGTVGKVGWMAINESILAKLKKEASNWAEEKPEGGLTLVWGPAVSASCAPYALFLAMCKKTSKSVGWKSIAFVIANEYSDYVPANIYDFSTSVNSLELRCGYDLFPKLPDGIQELIEEMTAYELFCPFQETEDEVEMMEDGREVFNDDALEDFANSVFDTKN